MRTIDADRLQKQFDEKSTNPNYRVNMHNIKSIISNATTVEAIPKDQYESRLKADMVAMLEDLRLDFQEAELAGVFDNKELIFADEVDDLVQQKINALKGETHD